MILVDSSAWIEFQRATGSDVDRALARLIADERPLATTGIVILELLAGARDEDHARRLRALLGRCRLLALEEPSDHEAAGALYRACRRGGATIRRLPDCLIAAVAIRAGTPLLQRDADFEAIARHAPLELASLP